MIREHYTIENAPNYLAFRFESIGAQGVIDKFVVFENMGDGLYNLAFGDFIEGRADDKVVSNNHDTVKTISTVVRVVYLFFEKYPEAVLEIDAVDEKRLRFYNRIFNRRYHEIEENYVLLGCVGDNKERYDPSRFYEKFEIRQRIH